MSIDSIMTAIADKIRSLLGISDKLGLVAMSTNLETANTEVATQEELMNQIIETLYFKSAVGSDNFIMTYGTGLRSMFYNAVLPENTEIVFCMPNFMGIIDSFAASCTNLKSFKLISSNNGFKYNIGSAFNECRTIELIDFSECNNGIINPIGTNESRYVFRRCNNLKEIKGEFDFSNLTGEATGMFQECYALEKITFKENAIIKNLSFSYSESLNDDSIQSIIDGLQDLTNVTSQTLTFHKDVKAKLTETQLATITSKNWTLA